MIRVWHVRLAAWPFNWAWQTVLHALQDPILLLEQCHARNVHQELHPLCQGSPHAQHVHLDILQSILVHTTVMHARRAVINP